MRPGIPGPSRKSLNTPAYLLPLGMAQDLSAAGMELPELMTAGRWDSPTMPAKYTEARSEGKGAVARYYRGDLRK